MPALPLPRARRRPLRPLCAALGALALLGAAVLLAPAAGRAQGRAAPGAPAVSAASGGEGRAELAFIERLYRERDDYRAESELLRFLHERPQHPDRPAVELARAKLYYRAGRYGEANLMLYSLLDRFPRGDAAPDARRLLTFSHLRLGAPARAAETADALVPAGQPPPSLAEQALPPPGAVDGEAAERWSTWLPGSGYAVLGEPGKAAAGVTLNLALLGAAVASARQDNAPAAALFLLLEAMLWQGGRSGVRQEAEAINRRLRERRSEEWLTAHGEPRLLSVGIALDFGGG